MMNTCEFAEDLKFSDSKHKVCGFCGDETRGCWADESLRDLWHREHLVLTMLRLEQQIPGPYRANYDHDRGGRLYRYKLYRAADIRVLYVALEGLGPARGLETVHQEDREVEVITSKGRAILKRRVELCRKGEDTVRCPECRAEQFRRANRPINMFVSNRPSGPWLGWSAVYHEDEWREVQRIKERGLGNRKSSPPRSRAW